MKKHKLLRFGHCYSNEAQNLVIGLLRGNKRRGYTFAASTTAPFILEKIWMPSRIVPNDGHWKEVSFDLFCNLCDFHSHYRMGYKI